MTVDTKQQTAWALLSQGESFLGAVEESKGYCERWRLSQKTCEDVETTTTVIGVSASVPYLCPGVVPVVIRW